MTYTRPPSHCNAVCSLNVESVLASSHYTVVSFYFQFFLCVSALPCSQPSSRPRSSALFMFSPHLFSLAARLSLPLSLFLCFVPASSCFKALWFILSMFILPSASPRVSRAGAAQLQVSAKSMHFFFLVPFPFFDLHYGQDWTWTYYSSSPSPVGV